MLKFNLNHRFNIKDLIERIPYKNNPEFLNDLYASHIQKNVKKAINEPILQANEGIVV